MNYIFFIMISSCFVVLLQAAEPSHRYRIRRTHTRHVTPPSVDNSALIQALHAELVNHVDIMEKLHGRLTTVERQAAQTQQDQQAEINRLRDSITLLESKQEQQERVNSYLRDQITRLYELIAQVSLRRTDPLHASRRSSSHLSASPGAMGHYDTVVDNDSM